MPSVKALIVLANTGYFTGVIANGATIAATCAATAEGAVSAVVIDRCYLTNHTTNHPSTLPGSATASVFTEGENTLSFTLCWHAYAIPVTDPTHPVVAGSCAQPVAVGGQIGGVGQATGTN